MNAAEMAAKSSRYCGRAVVAAASIVAACLSMYYTAKFAFEPSRLNSLPGEASYTNRLGPPFSYLLLATMWSLVWAVPTAALATLFGLAMRAMRLSIPQTSRIVLASGLALIAVVTLHMWSLDGLHGSFVRLLLGEDTYFAAGYSDGAFRRIRPGMTVEEVVARLGQPIHVCDRSSLAIHYFQPQVERYVATDFSERWSCSPTSSNYRIRNIHFVDHRVARKHAEFYLD